MRDGGRMDGEEREFRGKAAGEATGRCVMTGRIRLQLGGLAAKLPGSANSGWQPHQPMIYAFTHLNWLAVFGTAVLGFLLGWLWYSPVLFAKPWMAEMKITPEHMKAAAEKGMAKLFAQSFLSTLLSTLALAMLVGAIGSAGALKGAELGGFLGLVLVGARLLNAGVWEQRTLRLQAINIGHEVVLLALQGAVLAVWR